jgi:hypothetical protein
MERKNINQFLKDAGITERFDKDIPLKICIFDKTYIWTYNNKYILCGLGDTRINAIQSLRSNLKKKYTSGECYEKLQPFFNDNPPSDVLKQRIMSHVFNGWQSIFDNSFTVHTSRDAMTFINKIEPWSRQLADSISLNTTGVSVLDFLHLVLKCKTSLKVLFNEVSTIHNELKLANKQLTIECDKTNVMLNDVFKNCTAEMYYKYESQSCEMKIQLVRLNREKGLWYSTLIIAMNKLLRFLFVVFRDDEKLIFFKDMVTQDKTPRKVVKISQRRSKRLSDKSNVQTSRIMKRLSLVINKRTSKTVHVRRSARINNSNKLIIN